MEKDKDTLAKPPTSTASTPPAPNNSDSDTKRPVMDVKPRSPQTPEAKPSAPVQPPPEEPKDEGTDDKPKTKEKAKADKSEAKPNAKPPKPQEVKPPKQPGVGVAIFATVVIVLGLSALVVYAYLQQQV